MVTVDYTPRPFTNCEWIDEKNPIDVLNFMYEANRNFTPKLLAEAREILENGNGEEKKFMSELLDVHQEHLVAAQTVSRWFMEESKKHIVMMEETDDEVIITYDSVNNWFDTDIHKIEFYKNEDVHEIKDQLKSLGLPVSGRKEVISIRLYDALFGDGEE